MTNAVIKMPVITIYHIGTQGRQSFSADYEKVIGGVPLQWRYIDEAYATLEGIREWLQQAWPSQASVWADNSHQLAYYTFMSHDRMLVILL